MKKKSICTLLFLVVASISSILSPDVQATPTLTEGLFGFYPFSGNANDMSGNEHHGTVYGAMLTTDRFGYADSAYLFDGVDDYIDCGISSSFKTIGDISLSAWIKRESERYTFIAMEAGPGDTQSENATFYLSITLDGKLKYIHEYGSGMNEEHNFSPTQEDHWAHIAVVRDSSAKTVTAYFDGSYVGTFYYTYQPFNPNSELNLTIGSRSTGISNFNGAIDDVRFYNRILSSSEVMELYLIPEPATLLLLGLGGLAIRKRR